MSRTKSGFAEWWAREGERWYADGTHIQSTLDDEGQPWALNFMRYFTPQIAREVYDSIVASLGSVQTNLIGKDATP
jgi:hypothetical protein